MKKKIKWTGFVRVMVLFVFVTVLSFPFLQSCQKEEIKKKTNEPENVTIKNGGILQFFNDPAGFPCNGLPTEDFEKADPCSVDNPVMLNPLDENTNNSLFSSGEILQGISIHSSGSYLFIGAPCYLQLLPSIAVFTQSPGDYLIIDFTNNNVYSVSMNVHSSVGPYFENPTTIEIFGASGSLGSTTVIAQQTGIYIGVQSEVAITSITITPLYGTGVDNLMFGTCNTDSDGDGCPDSEDAVINSNMEEFVNLDGCSSGVPNRMTLGEPCGTMMSDVIDGLEEGTYKNHGEFVKAVANVVNAWYGEGLISLEEKDAIMTCAGKSSIGF